MGPLVTAPVAEAPRPVPTTAVSETRDWEGWYEALTPSERRRIRDRLLLAGYEEVRDDPQLRFFFLFHASDLAEEAPPGTARLRELHAIVATLQGRADPDLVAARRKAAAFLLAEYQAYLRDNPWAA